MTEATIESVDQLAAAAPDPVLSITDIENSRDAQYIVVDVPEWNGRVRLSTMTADGIELLTKAKETGDVVDGLLQLLVQSFVDADGNHQVTDPVRVVEVAKRLRKKEAIVLERLMRAYCVLNQIDIVEPSMSV